MVPFIDIWVKLETKELRAFIEASEKAFDASLEAFAAYVSEQAKGMTSEMQEQYESFTADEAFALAERFPRFGRHMAFVGAFGFFEKTLLSVCERVGRTLSLGFSYRDLVGNGIEVAKVYLTKGAKITEPFQGQNWQRIVTYGKVRNLILHNDAQFPNYYLPTGRNEEQVKRFKSIVKATRSIDIDAWGRFTLSKEYCVSAIDTIDAFFDELYPYLPSNTSSEATS